MASKQLVKLIATGKVVVKNKTPGEVSVAVPKTTGGRMTILVGAYATVELAPKYTPADMLNRGSNLSKLVEKGVLRLV